jgi:hypothetical protein
MTASSAITRDCLVEFLQYLNDSGAIKNIGVATYFMDKWLDDRNGVQSAESLYSEPDTPFNMLDVLRDSEVIKELYSDEEITDKWLEEHKNELIPAHSNVLELYHMLRAKTFYSRKIGRVWKQVVNKDVCGHELPYGTDIINDVINYNQTFVPLMEWLCIDGKEELDSEYFTASMILVQEIPHPLDDEHLYYAIIAGDIEVIKYIIACGVDTSAAMKYAVHNNKLSCLKYMFDHEFPRDINLCTFAAEGGSIGCFEYLISKGFKASDDVYASAIGYDLEDDTGRGFEFIEHLRKNGYPMNESAMVAAVCSSSLKHIEYLHRNGCPWYPNLYKQLFEDLDVAGDNLVCLKYMHTHGYPWYIDACTQATKSKRLDCLKYMVENGCPIDITACMAVAKDDCAEYLESLTPQS